MVLLCSCKVIEILEIERIAIVGCQQWFFNGARLIFFSAKEDEISTSIWPDDGFGPKPFPLSKQPLKDKELILKTPIMRVGSLFMRVCSLFMRVCGLFMRVCIIIKFSFIWGRNIPSDTNAEG